MGTQQPGRQSGRSGGRVGSAGDHLAREAQVLALEKGKPDGVQSVQQHQVAPANSCPVSGQAGSPEHAHPPRYNWPQLWDWASPDGPLHVQVRSVE